MGEKLVLPVHGETHLADGTYIIVRKVNPLRVGYASATALHEARHAVAAELNGTSVLWATVISGDGYLGLTALSSFDAVAAAAPHAHGDSGTDYDMHLVSQSGESAGAAASAARSILASREAELMVQAVATALHGTLSGGEIRNIMQQVKEGDVLEITIIRPNGTREVQAGMRARVDETAVSVPVDTKPSLASGSGSGSGSGSSGGAGGSGSGGGGGSSGGQKARAFA